VRPGFFELWVWDLDRVVPEPAALPLELLAGPELREQGIDVVDTQIRQWMEQNRIRWACWNGTRLPKVFPTSFEIGHTFTGERYDVAWSARDTGLFYQNFMLGSVIQEA